MVPEFRRHVRIIKGASGGMLGAAYYLKHCRDVLKMHLCLMPEVSHPDQIRATGKNELIVARMGLDRVIHFRMFNDKYEMVMDTNERALQNQEHQLDSLKDLLNGLWNSSELSRRDEERVISSVTSIAGHVGSTQWVKNVPLASIGPVARFIAMRDVWRVWLPRRRFPADDRAQ
jgi:hypothetical protein